MRKSIILLFLLMIISSFGIHKFFVSIYQINYNQKATRLEITSRIFEDDLNAVLYKKYNKKTNLGEKNESEEDLLLMQKYLAEKLIIKVNSKIQILHFLSKENEGHEIVCYFNIQKINKINSIEIENTALFEISNQQQNIIQTTIYGKKETQILTVDKSKKTLWAE